MTKPKRILITGPPGSGKTTLIKRLAERIEKPKHGFFTSEIRQGRNRIGFEIETFSGEKATLAHVDFKSPQVVSKYGVDIESFERIALPEMEAALSEKSLLVIDEIGKMELFSEQFKELLLKVFSSNLSLWATIMIAPNPFCDKLKQAPETALYLLQKGGAEELTSKILEEVEK